MGYSGGGTSPSDEPSDSHQGPLFKALQHVENPIENTLKQGEADDKILG